MRESEIEKYLVKQAKELGGEVRKLQWIGRRGAPDRVVMMPFLSWASGPCVVWVELKATGEKPGAHQLREHERLRKMGQHVEVIDSLEGVDRLLA